LIVLGDDLDPSVVSSALGLFPNQSWSADEQIRYRDGEGNDRHHESLAEYAGWKRYVPDEMNRESLEKQLEFWLGLLEARAEGVSRLLAMGWSIAVDCYLSTVTTELLELPAERQKRFGALGVDVDIHFFADSPIREDRT